MLVHTGLLQTLKPKLETQPAENRVESVCKHSFCRECVHEYETCIQACRISIRMYVYTSKFGVYILV